MFNVGGGEVIVILLIALIVLGPDKLPGAARQVGKYLNEFRRISSGFQDEIRSAMDVTNQTVTDAPPAASPTEPGAADPEADATTPAADGPASAPTPASDVTTEPAAGPSATPAAQPAADPTPEPGPPAVDG